MLSHSRLTRGRNKPTTKITDAILIEVLTKIGCYEKDYQIAKWVRETHGISIIPQTITHYRRSERYENFIKQAREKYESQVFSLELTSKRRRIEELSEIYWIMKQSKKYDRACRILEQIRYEREGSKVETGDIFQFNQYNNMSDEALKNRIEVNMKMIEDIKTKKMPSVSETTETIIEQPETLEGDIDGERN